MALSHCVTCGQAMAFAQQNMKPAFLGSNRPIPRTELVQPTPKPTPMIDIKKRYQTRDRREVRIYAVDGAGSLCVHGAIKEGSGWFPYYWDINGQRDAEDFALVEITPPLHGFVNVYQGSHGLYFGGIHSGQARSEAPYEGGDPRVATIPITYQPQPLKA